FLRCDLTAQAVAASLRPTRRRRRHLFSWLFLRCQINQKYRSTAELVSHAAAGRRGTSVSIQIAVLCVIGVLVAPVVIAATEPEASATMKVIAAEVAACLGMQTRKAAAESRATTGEMASAKAAAHMSAPEPPAHMSAAEPAAHMSAAAPA